MNTLDQTFQALADPTRRAILERLQRGPATVGELNAPFAISGPAVSRHLKVLEAADLITNERDGKQRICALKPERLAAAADWLEFSRDFWNASLARLDRHLASKNSKESK